MKRRPTIPAVIDAGLTPGEKRLYKTLRTPHDIQEFLDSLAYSAESRYRSPRSVIADRTAHCYDGAVFAASALRMIGEAPLIVSILSVRDDDHIIAIFRRHGRVGAVAKSNFVGLRFREPVYRDLRELIMSYFDVFYNLRREKTLRGFTSPLDLSTLDREHWMVRDEALDRIADTLDSMRVHTVMTPSMIRSLQPIDQRSFAAGLAGANPKGLYRP